MLWYQFKLFISHSLSLSMDALHMLVGTIALVVIARLFRVPISDSRPWFALLAIELLNEAGDTFVERWPDAASQAGESAKDVLLTMVVPTILLLTARYRPAYLTGSVDHDVTGRSEIVGAGSAVPGGEHQGEASREDAAHGRCPERIIDQTVD